MEQEPPCSLWKHKCGQPHAPVLGVHPTEGLRSFPEPLCPTFPFPIFPVVSSLPERKRVFDTKFPPSTHLTFEIFVKNRGRKEG